ncbi:MAG: polypeptide deformylase [Parcubacteria group bacterium LiPW_15]|nr:MAG: polypeptide deformylase [Parcubacteria group bacterium LiPW_15]
MDHIWKLADKKEEKLLREKAVPFDFNSMSRKEIQEMVTKMRKMMKEANGVGLAANQVGLPFHMFVAEVPDEKSGGKKFYALFNSKVERNGKETNKVEEGCLSVPLTYGEVERPSRVTLTGQDKTGKLVKIKAWGLLARVFQHETDHLNGIVFIDRAKTLYDLVLEEDEKH